MSETFQQFACKEHEYRHLRSAKTTREYGKYTIIDTFFCVKCLDIKKIDMTVRHDEWRQLNASWEPIRVT